MDCNNIQDVEEPKAQGVESSVIQLLPFDMSQTKSPRDDIVWFRMDKRAVTG